MDESGDLPDFAYGSLLVSLHLGLCWSRRAKNDMDEGEENAKLVLGSNTRFDDVSFLERFESIVQNIPFGLHIGERERDGDRSFARELTFIVRRLPVMSSERFRSRSASSNRYRPNFFVPYFS